MDTKETKTPAKTSEPREGPEARGQQSAATLEEALAKQDELAREGNKEAAEEGQQTREELEEETNAAIEEAGAAQEARDDEVYGREPGGEDRRIGYANVPESEAAPKASKSKPA